jgi:2-polyprenyl-3-methyl-5-hydroxy-6-metoxy-1,4-benzoquinol methylase
MAQVPHDFDASYAGTPPWDIGHPQPAFSSLASSGAVTGRVLDVGCGTGEHALMAAALGLDATGVDFSPRAIQLAQRKAQDRGLSCRFEVGDALELDSIGDGYDTVLDCGLFHVFDDSDRIRFASGLAAAVRPGGHYFMLCFSDLEPGDWGPRRIKKSEIAAHFTEGWHVEAIDEARIDLTLNPEGAHAWLATISKT